MMNHQLQLLGVKTFLLPGRNFRNLNLNILLLSTCIGKQTETKNRIWCLTLFHCKTLLTCFDTFMVVVASNLHTFSCIIPTFLKIFRRNLESSKQEHYPIQVYGELYHLEFQTREFKCKKPLRGRHLEDEHTMMKQK